MGRSNWTGGTYCELSCKWDISSLTHEREKSLYKHDASSTLNNEKEYINDKYMNRACKTRNRESGFLLQKQWEIPAQFTIQMLTLLRGASETPFAVLVIWICLAWECLHLLDLENHISFI